MPRFPPLPLTFHKGNGETFVTVLTWPAFLIVPDKTNPGSQMHSVNTWSTTEDWSNWGFNTKKWR